MSNIILIILLIIILVAILIYWIEAVREDFDKPPLFKK